MLFNTLAQSETGFSTNGLIIVRGEGSELTNQKAIKGRAKWKLITTNGYEHGSGSKGRTPKAKSVLEHLSPPKQDIYADGRLYGKYCKNRFCTLCLSIRKADIINRYMPVIQKWEDPHFVTITARAVPLRSLNKRVSSLINGFGLITVKYRKRHQRGKGIKLVGIKSIESNFNPRTKTYNPHMHLIVANRQMADTIKREWLRMCPDHLAKPYAQKITKVWDKEKALMEVIKYGSKIFTEPDVRNKQGTKSDRDIYSAALDNIFTAMKSHRIFNRFGFNLPKRAKEGGSTVLSLFEEWEFDIC